MCYFHLKHPQYTDFLNYFIGKLGGDFTVFTFYFTNQAFIFVGNENQLSFSVAVGSLLCL